MHTVLFLQNIGIGEIVIIALVILLLFGGKKIPELMKGLGKGVKSFKQGMSEVEEEINKVDEDIKKSVSDEPKKKDSEEK
ncbi:MAG: twin-arginine translocase TatA/TatE family subunit [Bacteroidales bacterium]|nr:twin-arginine translocase TatA/TatE family subunit [Bacteroidales bacterium]MDO5322202.1 twin-arginine translocase TatA/TatE family subunit [Bacteroidia bacterium]